MKPHRDYLTMAKDARSHAMYIKHKAIEKMHFSNKSQPVIYWKTVRTILFIRMHLKY